MIPIPIPICYRFSTGTGSRFPSPPGSVLSCWSASVYTSLMLVRVSQYTGNAKTIDMMLVLLSRGLGASWTQCIIKICLNLCSLIQPLVGCQVCAHCTRDYSCVQNLILPLVYLNTGHFKVVHFLCSALISTG